MANAANFRIDQLTSGTPGVARRDILPISDGVPPVSLVADNAALISYQWEITQPPGSTATVSGSTTNTCTINVVDIGGYRAKLTVDAGLPTEDVCILYFGIPVSIGGTDYAFPAINETIEDNSRTSTWWGWGEKIHNLLLALATSGGYTYTNPDEMPVTVGGWEAGSSFSGNTLAEMFDGLLYPYQYPAFTSFSISGQAPILEVGDVIPINRTFVWTTVNDDTVEPDTLVLNDVTDHVVIASALANDGSEVTSYPTVPIQLTNAGSYSFLIEGDNTRLDTFSLGYTVYWQWRRFYGESTNPGALIEADILNLRVSGLVSGYAGTYAFIATGYKYVCYPTSLGLASTFKDELTNLDVPFEAPYSVNVENGFGITTSYRVHRSTNIIGSSINIIVTGSLAPPPPS